MANSDLCINYRFATTLRASTHPGAMITNPEDAEKNPVTAIDILLKPDGVMVQRALAANARLRETFPKGFAFDDTHHPHLTLVQQFVRTDHLDKVFAAANAVLAGRIRPDGR